MTDDDWITAGYKWHDVSNHDLHKHASYLLQKRFDDEEGKKYFITVYCYDRSKYPPPHNKGIGYMPTAHFTLGDNMPFFNVEMNGIESWDGGVNGVEAWFDALWKGFGKPYYEKWEGTVPDTTEPRRIVKQN